MGGIKVAIAKDGTIEIYVMNRSAVNVV